MRVLRPSLKDFVIENCINASTLEIASLMKKVTQPRAAPKQIASALTFATKYLLGPISQMGGAPRALIDQQSRSPYKRITETKGPLDQINIRTDGGFLVDLAQRSKVVAELQTYKLLRIYHDSDDTEAKDKIRAIIDARIKKWPQ